MIIKKIIAMIFQSLIHLMSCGKRHVCLNNFNQSYFEQLTTTQVDVVKETILNCFASNNMKMFQQHNL
jgi:hypothetical protein